MWLLEVEGFGSLKVDTAYGGDSFVIANAKIPHRTSGTD